MSGVWAFKGMLGDARALDNKRVACLLLGLAVSNPEIAGFAQLRAERCCD